MSGHRTERVADQIRRVLARRVREVRDPRVGFVTLTEVRLSSDLRHAVVYFTAMNPDARGSTEDGLNHAVPFLRRTLAREARLRFTPELRFLYDEAFESGQRLDSLLKQVHDDFDPPDRKGSD